MARKTFLDSISVPKPCDKSWDEMIGNDLSRLCLHCDTKIHNLSEMSSKEVEKLLFQKTDRVCVRMTRDADGKVQTNDRKFHQIKRNARLAASFLSITLALTTVPFAQSPTTKNSVETQSKTQQNLLTLTITDSNKAVIPNAQVKLINLETKKEQTGRSNENGELQFVIDKLGRYEMIVDGISGFKQLKKTVELTNEHVKITLRLEVEESVVGTTAPSNVTEILGRSIAGLPKPSDSTIGLILETKEQRKLREKTSQISFTILDPNGGIIPNAEVKLTSDKTKKEFIVNTNDQGVACFSFLERGRYIVEATAIGFIRLKTAIIVKERIEPNIELKLDIGNFVIGVFVDNSSEIPIFNSILQEDFEVVNNYISDRKNVNIKEKSSGKTMLHLATQSGNFEIVKHLIEAGARVNEKDALGRTPLLTIGGDNRRESEKIIRLLIDKSADVDVRDKATSHQTLLMKACYDDDFEGVRFILELGANPNLKDDDGETAMMKTSSEEIKALLKKFGAKK